MDTYIFKSKYTICLWITSTKITVIWYISLLWFKKVVIWTYHPPLPGVNVLSSSDLTIHLILSLQVHSTKVITTEQDMTITVQACYVRFES